MKFIEKPRRGEVLGNKIIAKPVSFALAVKAMRAETDADRVEALAAVVRECVTMEDGSPVEPSEISVEAVGELAKFALEGKGELADFT